MEQELHFEHGDLTGEISINMKEGMGLEDFCSRFIHNYNRDRLEALAIRIYFGKELVVTLYAVDKLSQETKTLISNEKIPVKKFKIPGIPLHELLTYIGSMNCTLSTNNFPIEAMEVVNT